MKKHIKTRLYFGVATALLLVIMVGVISYATFRHQIEEAQTVRHSFRVINQLETLQNLMIDMETGRRGFRSTNETKFLDPYTEALVKIDPVQLQIKQLLKDNPGQLERFSNVEKSIDELLAFWKNNGDDPSQYTREKITFIAEDEKKRMDQFRNQVQEIKTAEQTLLAKGEAANKQNIDLATVELLMGIALILVIVGVLIYFILREFNHRTKAEADLHNNNQQLVLLNDESAEKNWQLAGLAKVNNSIQGVTNTQKLSEVILNSLINYLQVNAGAFYLYNNEQQRLVLAASVALNDSLKKTYLVNEGYVGKAAAQTKPLVIKNIQPTDISQQSQTKQGVPVEAIYSALYLNNELKGVYELITTKGVEQRQSSLLNLVNNNIAVAINSAQAREQVMELLETVQLQKEELENQQEELKQANEELNIQTEVLQSSEEELRVQEGELRQINAELEEKNESVETARQELDYKAKELESNNKYKTEFLANMSHELRTPLNSVLILAKLLAANTSNNLTEKQVAHANIIFKSGSDLLQLINDVLDLSKIEAGKVDLHVEDVLLTAIASDMEQVFNVMADEKGIHLAVNIDKALPPSVSTDKQKLEQVLKNLLSNAIKFTPEDGRISLNFNGGNESGVPVLSIGVIDSGIGISLTKQHLIFEAFQQADGSTNRKYGGTGLGLSITKELVRLLGGKINLKSEEGKGSTFTVIIPFKMEEAVQQSALGLIQKLTNKLPGQIEEQQVITDDRRQIQPGDKVMLVIEDDQLFAGIIRDFARQKGYKTLVAVKGDEGLHYARKYKPDAIILDMKLPVIQGSELLKILKNSKELKHIPVHIITAAEEDSVDSSAALAFLQKPLIKEDIDNAFAKIDEYLKSSVKKVLLLSGEHLKDNMLQQLFGDWHFDVQSDIAESAGHAMEMINKVQYDCIVADIGANVNDGITNLGALHTKLRENSIPLIIYLDKDITPVDERELKKVSEAIVRKSSSSNSRLMDELELFLYKVNQSSSDTQSAFIHSEALNGLDLKSKNVLLVDDDMRNVFALSAALEHEEMNIITAGDGKEALDALQKHSEIDIVLMDIMMPEMDGFEAMRYIRNELKLTQLPIIALTAKAMTGDREKCIKAGASDYITKPVDTQKLLSLMRVWLS